MSCRKVAYPWVGRFRALAVLRSTGASHVFAYRFYMRVPPDVISKLPLLTALQTRQLRFAYH